MSYPEGNGKIEDEDEQDEDAAENGTVARSRPKPFENLGDDGLNGLLVDPLGKRAGR